MSKEVKKLYFVFSAFVVNIIAIPIIGVHAQELVAYIIFTLCVVLLPLYVLYSKDALASIGRVSNMPAHQSIVVWVIACLPTLTFGLLAIAIGVSIVAWVVYNVLIERQPEYSGAFLGLGLGPGLLCFGLLLLKSLWIKRKIV